MKHKNFYFLFIIILVIKSSLNEEIIVTATNEVTTKCDNGLYFIEIKVYFSSSFSNYYTFPLSLLSPSELKLKCSFTYEKKSILCIGNLNSNKFDLEMGEFIILPQKFPKLENINWDYDSFVKNIYGKEWVIVKDCLQKKFGNYFNNEWGFIFNITNVKEDKCSNSINEIDYKYNFQIKANILDGKLKNLIETFDDNKNIEIEFLQDLWVPMFINLRRGGNFRKVDDFSFAFCSIKEKISKLNIDYLINEGLYFDCYVPIPEGKLLIGAMQILPFYDYLYYKISKEDKNEIIFENIFFNINRTFEYIYKTPEKPIDNLPNIIKNHKKRITENNDTYNSDINVIESDKNNLYSDNVSNNNDTKEINNDENNETINNNNNNENEKNERTDELTNNNGNKDIEINDKNSITINNNDNNDNKEIENTDRDNNNNNNENEKKERTDELINNNENRDIENNDKINSTNNNNDNNKKNENDNNYKNNTTIDNNNENNSNKNENDNNTIIQNIKEEKEIISLNYFIIGSKNKIYCPDKPIFHIKDSNNDILLFSSNNNDYTFMLKGLLTNGLQEIENKYFSIIETYEDITFSLQIIDNLAEDEDDQRAQAICSIPSGTPFYKNITIFCNAEKISEESMKTNDTDITLNWGLEKNRIHEDIIINWPNDKKKIKHIYSYYIQGFSLVQTNYGCFNNEFYFYIYIYNLEHQTDINFEIQMKNPVEPKALCKLYESSILKCYFPLYQQKLEKFTTIDLPTNFTYYSIDEKGNKVIFEVDDYDFDYDDFHITLREDCGENFIVGALKKAGFDYFKIFLIVIGIAAFAFIVFICFICYVYYKIKYRNRKGIYVRHIEEDINTNNNNIPEGKEKKIEIISSKSLK